MRREQQSVLARISIMPEMNCFVDIVVYYKKGAFFSAFSSFKALSECSVGLDVNMCGEIIYLR